METQTDLRRIHNPWADPNVSGVGRLRGRNATHQWVGTAELIDREYVLTAAHCLQGATAAQVTFGYDPDASTSDNQKRTYQIMAGCIPVQFVQGNNRFDFAVARLARPVEDKEIGILKLFKPGAMGWMGFDKTPIHLVGYPAAREGVTPTEAPEIAVGPMYWQQGHVTSGYNAETNTASYELDTRGGHSGGPVIKTATNEIVCLHVRFAVENAKQVGQGMMLTGSVHDWINAARQALQHPTTFVTQL